MDAEQREAMTDAEVDRELRALLAVDPSAEFASGIRRRIVEAPAPAWWWSPMLVATVAVVAVIVVGIVVTMTRPELRSSESFAQLPDTSPAVREVEPTRAAPPATISGPRRPEPREPVRHTLDQPEVMIDAREASAIRALMRAASDGRIDLQLAATTPSVMELPPIEDVAITPLVIPPLEEGARQ